MSKSNPSRRERYEEVLSKVEEAKYVAEELKEELENWLDNMPENLQSGTKADELQEAIDTLEEVYDNLDTVTGLDVMFPSMF